MPKYVIGIVIGVLLSSAAIVLAGSMEPPSGPTDPASQMYTLEQIYNRLNTGAAATRMTTFTEPGSGPGATGRTLDEVMAVARTGSVEVACPPGEGWPGRLSSPPTSPERGVRYPGVACASPV